MFKIRFHLKNGKNFLNWQITNIETGVKQYVDPELHDLVMGDCKLHNRKGVANSIFKGGEKNVCAWIVCTAYTTRPRTAPEGRSQAIRYNPRDCIHWHLESDTGTNLDNARFKQIVSSGRKLFSIN